MERIGTEHNEIDERKRQSSGNVSTKWNNIWILNSIIRHLNWQIDSLSSKFSVVGTHCEFIVKPFFIARLSCTHMRDKPNTKWDMNASIKFEMDLNWKCCRSIENLLSNACESNKHYTIEFNIHFLSSIKSSKKRFSIQIQPFRFRLDGKSTFWMLICSIHETLSDLRFGFILSICFLFSFQISFGWRESTPWDNSGNYLIRHSTRRNRDDFPNYHIWFDAFIELISFCSLFRPLAQGPWFLFIFFYRVYDLSVLFIEIHLIIYYLLLHFHQRCR